MKKISLFLLLAVLVSSCSNEEVTSLENNQTSLLKTFKVKRDATGAYSVDFNVTENTKVEQFIEAKNTSEYLLSSSNIKSKKEFSQDLLIDNDQLKVSIVDANSNKKSSITVIDDNIALQRKGSSTMLAGYSVQGNEDGTFDLEFDVNDDVAVSFVYNEAISTYEIHLEEGISNSNAFARTLEKEAGEPLKIDFVNHINNPNAKSTELAMITRKPEVIIN